MLHSINWMPSAAMMSTSAHEHNHFPDLETVHQTHRRRGSLLGIVPSGETDRSVFVS